MFDAASGQRVITDDLLILANDEGMLIKLVEHNYKMFVSGTAT
jgi:hypothetical protein